MQFPRFTDGAVGRLTFAHLNDLFARVEALEGSAPDPGAMRGRVGRLIPCRVTGQPEGGVYSWVEVERQGTAWVDKVDGLSSTDPSQSPPDAKAFPIIGSIAEPFPTPTFILPQYRADGSLFYLPTAPGAVGSAPYKIVSFTNLVLGKSWQYGLQRQKIVTTAGIPSFSNDANFAPVIGLNGAENRTDPPYDAPTNDLYGVGWARPPQGFVRQRNPIQLGIIVQAVPVDGSNFYSFSIGNGYTTVCQ